MLKEVKEFENRLKKTEEKPKKEEQFFSELEVYVEGKIGLDGIE